MRIIFTIIKIIYFAISLIASEIDFKYYTGIWQNPKHGIKMKIITYKDGLEVTSLHRKNKQNWFERINKFTFQDHEGNKIYLSDDVIFYRPYRSKRKLTLHKVSNRAKYTNSNNYKTRPNYYQEENQEHNNRSKMISSNGKTYQISNITPDKIEGSWLAKDVDKVVFITETRDGLKARFIDDTKWYPYTFNKKTKEYISSDGHKYIVYNYNLVWIDYTGNKEITLIKISDDLYLK